MYFRHTFGEVTRCEKLRSSLLFGRGLAVPTISRKPGLTDYDPKRMLASFCLSYTIYMSEYVIRPRLKYPKHMQTKVFACDATTRLHVLGLGSRKAQRKPKASWFDRRRQNLATLPSSSILLRGRKQQQERKHPFNNILFRLETTTTSHQTSTFHTHQAHTFLISITGEY